MQLASSPRPPGLPSPPPVQPAPQRLCPHLPRSAAPGATAQRGRPSPSGDPDSPSRGAAQGLRPRQSRRHQRRPAEPSEPPAPGSGGGAGGAASLLPLGRRWRVRPSRTGRVQDRAPVGVGGGGEGGVSGTGCVSNYHSLKSQLDFRSSRFTEELRRAPITLHPVFSVSDTPSQLTNR